MKDGFENRKFIHIRPLENTQYGESQFCSRSGVTICFYQSNQLFYFGYSVCNKIDNFSKKLGRKISENRANTTFVNRAVDRAVVLPSGENYSYKDYVNLIKDRVSSQLHSLPIEEIERNPGLVKLDYYLSNYEECSAPLKAKSLKRKSKKTFKTFHNTINSRPITSKIEKDSEVLKLNKVKIAINNLMKKKVIF